MVKNFYEAIANRRSFYGINKETVISDEKIKELIEHAIKHTPSAFNSQSTRVILLLDKQHDKLWNITKEALRKVISADKFKSTEKRINSFGNGYGTILFFEDNSTIRSLQEQFPSYKEDFPLWSEQTSGMHQYVIWTALETEGFGVSLQHYNALMEDDIMQEWNVPANWRLIAQMPFGKPTRRPDEKTFNPLRNRIKVFK